MHNVPVHASCTWKKSRHGLLYMYTYDKSRYYMTYIFMPLNLTLFSNDVFLFTYGLFFFRPDATFLKSACAHQCRDFRMHFFVENIFLSDFDNLWCNTCCTSLPGNILKKWIYNLAHAKKLKDCFTRSNQLMDGISPIAWLSRKTTFFLFHS